VVVRLLSNVRWIRVSLPSENSAILILFGLILSEEIRFRRIDGSKKIVKLYDAGWD
jgi:hypothetical protein